MFQKYQQLMPVVGISQPGGTYHLIELACPAEIPLRDVEPGQFVEISVPGRKFMLRRPISICDIDEQKNHLLLLVDAVGEGTRLITQVKSGDSLDILFPLGKGFSLPSSSKASPLLVGGGVGIAPMLYLARSIYRHSGEKPKVLLGAKNAAYLKGIADRFSEFSQLYLCTDDGTLGKKGFVTDHEIWQQKHSHVYVCGPKPMMKSVAHKVAGGDACVEFSLENMMACGLGACLCCVEQTVTGNRCVCTEGPVFKLEELTWLKQQ
ncbi:dihydroorotate dehydrogenase electron transfer subunit [Porphyromonas crevioricanis]|uniref:Dihydroorotate dehydrogenase electron transfer subunit n=1 Tax=Porphyromonas crevioricanis JCM 15906 TaxID=1305617 RepID=T1CQR9_9PORP|nr:dihydroorotate dehydrogenase electron transfer subunit [Porphyromonas crevioricanis]GAD06177.1 dihydroorotate dehydrogenase electron transfer subunit [Porphyromonas crevioricanis JCM 15906]